MKHEDKKKDMPKLIILIEFISHCIWLLEQFHKFHQFAIHF